MRSSEIVQSYDHLKKVFSQRITHWMTLHRINAMGERGTNLSELSCFGGLPSVATLTEWEKAGLVERREIVREKLPRLVRYVATAKARRLLRVEDEVSTKEVWV